MHATAPTARCAPTAPRLIPFQHPMVTLVTLIAFSSTHSITVYRFDSQFPDTFCTKQGLQDQSSRRGAL